MPSLSFRRPEPSVAQMYQPPPVKYHVEVSPAREVTLLGEADADYWRQRLQPEGLLPTIRDGRSQLLLSSVEARFNGIRFRELSISIFVCKTEGSGTWDGAYLMHAFNSNRFFAFVERTFFATPYWPARIDVQSALPAAMEARSSTGSLLRAEMAQNTNRREPVRSGYEGWAGPIFLPSKPGRSGRSKLFFGKIVGDTQVYAFDREHDRLKFSAAPEDPAIGWLQDSNFVGRQWMIRAQATHGKSKTVRRDAVDPWAGSAGEICA